MMSSDFSQKRFWEAFGLKFLEIFRVFKEKIKSLEFFENFSFKKEDEDLFWKILFNTMLGKVSIPVYAKYQYYMTPNINTL